MSDDAPLIGAVEGGGTKFVCAVGTGPNNILETVRIPTTTPAETLEAVGRFFVAAKTRHGAVEAIGIGCFGPVDLDPKSGTYGYITTTPKPGWQNTDIVGALRQRFRVPIGFDTDVNAAVLGEYLWGAGEKMDPLVYLTIGTGVGGGVLVNGHLLHGLLHPEIGHIHVPPPTDSQAIDKSGQCPYHKHCVEGYVSGPAIANRWGARADRLPADSPAWAEVADVLAHALVNLTLTLSPRRIILGGGVMEQEHLISLIRGRFRGILNGYISSTAITKDLDSYIVRPGLGNRSGLLGALALGRAQANLKRKKQSDG
jgi:fructokinase